jgi:hypothetical protein
MKSIVAKVMLVAVALGAALFALAGTADASHVSATIIVPDEAAVGRPVEIQAVLKGADDGVPMAGTPVLFFTDASFGGVEGEVQLGQAVTDENGVAALIYEPRSASEHQIRIEYTLPGDSEPETITMSMNVASDGSQLYRSTAGVDIPGLNVWLLIAVVAIVWAILMSVAVRVIAIAHAGRDAETIAEEAILPGQAERQPASGAR